MLQQADVQHPPNSVILVETLGEAMYHGASPCAACGHQTAEAATLRSSAGHGLDRPQVAAAKKLVDVRNKLVETIHQVDELMGEGSPKA